MSTTYRYLSLVWQDPGGHYTAALVENSDNIAGIGPTRDAALWQLKDYLDARFHTETWIDLPELLDAELLSVGVDIRPEYRMERRNFPATETFRLRVPCVHGQLQSGLRLCSLPTLGIRFHFDSSDTLPSLVTHFVRNSLQGLAPRELARLQPPARLELAEVVARHREKPPSAQRLTLESPLYDLLREIAEPLARRRDLRGQFAPAWERERLVEDLARRLDHEKANVILLGETGSGKTSVLVETALQISRASREDAPPEPDDDSLDDIAPPAQYRFWRTSAARIIAGMKYLGQWEERCEQLVDVLSRIRGVLCLENLLDLARIGGRGPGDSVAAFLLPYLQRGEIQIVTESTPAELDAVRRLLPGLADHFHILPIPPLDRPAVRRVLARWQDSLASAHRVHPAPGLVETTARLFERFMPYEALPGHAALFLRDLFRHARDTNTPVLDTPALLRHFTLRTGLPEWLLRDDLPLREADVHAALARTVIGQPDAVHAATRVVLTIKAGLADPSRPLRVLLFAGPTGVGKTALAKALADHLFGAGEQTDRLLRLDMSEYAGYDAPLRLLGPPSGEPSELIRRIRSQPFQVVLLDEIEKAAPEVFDLLLNVLDEGRLTDPAGRPVTFRSAILIMTTNLGATRSAPAGFGSSRDTISYLQEAMQFFRPEFVNRMDEIVTFHPLDPQSVRAIAEKELADASQREGLRQRRITLRWTPALVDHLAADGYDRRYGARPLQRLLEENVITPLARWLLQRPGATHLALLLDWQSGTLHITPEDQPDLPQ